MPRTFIKEILRPGLYTLTDKGGVERKIPISPDRLRGWAAKFKRMLQSGINIPAPWRHDPRAVPVRFSGDVADVDAGNNAGWWKELWYDEGRNVLLGKVEVPRDEDATKVGTTVKEVSPLAKPLWVDGDGVTWEDVVTHIALVTHPVQPGQENFIAAPILVKDDILAPEAVALSLEALTTEEVQFGTDVGYMGQASPPHPDTLSSAGSVRASSVSVTDLMKLLQQLETPIVLPSDTSGANLMERLVTAIQAVIGAQKGQNEQGQLPGGSREEPPPIALSQETSTVATQTVTPPAAPAAPAAGEIQLSQEQQAAINFARKQAGKAVKTRIEALVATGRITADYANKILAPRLKGMEVAFSADGQTINSDLDDLLEMLEALPQGTVLTGMSSAPRRTKNQRFGDAFALAVDVQEEEAPFASMDTPDDEMTDEEAEKIVALQLKAAGVTMARGKEL